MATFEDEAALGYDDAEAEYETQMSNYVMAMAAEDYDEALECLDEALDASPLDAEAALCCALAHAMRGDECADDGATATLWLKRCERWRVDGRDALGSAWHERATRDFPPGPLAARPDWRAAMELFRKPAEGMDDAKGRAARARFLARRARRARWPRRAPAPRRSAATRAPRPTRPASSTTWSTTGSCRGPRDDARALATVVDGALDDETFEAMKEALAAHPLLTAGDSAAMGASFAGSAGFVVRFDGQGAGGLRGGRTGEAYAALFDGAARPAAPSPVPRLNLGGDDAADGAYAVDWHRDATLGLGGADGRPSRPRARVAVLYVNAPEATGGELCLREPARPLWRRDAARPRPVDRKIRPLQPPRRVHRWATREHAVAAFAPAASGGAFGGARVSVVLEQYAVPPGLRPFTIDFEIVDGATTAAVLRL
ncbi:hypothetical protein SO694_00069195 [Aureococcus anophagefferens]|uniref:Fe2OG dioxygenase domain-containing protein n=1 Tax=Aureococcus anophagefferens TaxID=44056 RepID=A0ABR1FQ44_AURAN